MDAVARVAFLQEPPGEVLSVPRHPGRVQIVDGGAAHIVHDGVDLGSGGGAYHKGGDPVQAGFCPLGGFQRQIQVACGGGRDLADAEVDREVRIILDQGNAAPVLPQGLPGNGVGGTVFGIGGAAADQHGAVLWVVGQQQLVPGTHGADGHVPGRLQTAIGWLEVLVPAHPAGLPPGAGVQVIVPGAEVQAAAPVGGDVHDPEIQLPHRPQGSEIYVSAAAVDSDVQIAAGNVVPEDPGHTQQGILQRLGVLLAMISRLGHRQKQGQQPRRGGQGQQRRQEAALPGIPAADSLAQHHNQQPRQQAEQGRGGRRGVRHHQAGRQGEQRRRKEREHPPGTADRPGGEQARQPGPKSQGQGDGIRRSGSAPVDDAGVIGAVVI